MELAQGEDMRIVGAASLSCNIQLQVDAMIFERPAIRYTSKTIPTSIYASPHSP